MSRMKKMVSGVVVAVCVLGVSVRSCYAAKGSITAEITASRAYGKFVCAEAGHEIKVTVYYKEKDAMGSVNADTISNVQHGTVTEAVVSRNSPSGYQYTWGQAFGYVDGNTAASSGGGYRTVTGKRMKKERGTASRIRFVCVLTAGIFLLSACGKGREKDADSAAASLESSETASDFEYRHVAESEKGYYFWERISPSQYYPRLMFMDKESGRVVPLCNKPDCDHEGKECNAYFPEIQWEIDGISKDYIQYCEGSLYAVGLSGDSYAAVFRIKEDGSEWEISTKLYKTDYSSSGHWRLPEILIDGGYVYFVDNKQSSMRLERIPVEGGTAEILFEGQSDAIYVKVYRMEVNEGNLFFQVFSLMEEDGNYADGDLYRYNAADGRCSLIKEGIFGPYSVQDGYVYYGSAEGLCRYSIRDDVIEVLNDRPMDVPNITLTRDYIVLCHQMEDNALSLYDYEGNEIATVPNRLGLHWYFGGDSDRLFGECVDEIGMSLCFLDLTCPPAELQWKELKAD